MGTREGRTTTKFYTLSQLVDLLGMDENSSIGGMKLKGLGNIVQRQHTLPMLYIKQHFNGTFSIVGETTKHILNTLLIELACQDTNRKKRVYREHIFHVLIFEPCTDQDSLIQAYNNAGIL